MKRFVLWLLFVIGILIGVHLCTPTAWHDGWMMITGSTVTLVVESFIWDRPRGYFPK